MKKVKKLLALVMGAVLMSSVVPTDTLLAKDVSTYSEDFGGGSTDNGNEYYEPITSTPGSPYGTFIKGADAESDDVYIKMVAKLKSSDYYYNTVGFTVHTDKVSSRDPGATNGDNAKNYPIYAPVVNPRDSKSPTGSPETLKSGEKLYFYGSTGEVDAFGNKKVAYVEDTQAGTVTATMKLNKSKMLNLYRDNSIDFNVLQKDPNGDFKFFASAASAVHQNGSWHSKPYYSYEAFKNGGGQGLWDAVGGSYGMYFNIPFKVAGTTKNTVSLFDVTTGKRIHFEDIGEVTLTANGKNTLSSAYGPQTIPETFTDKNGKQYKLFISQYLPGKMFPESSGTSSLESQYVTQLKQGKAEPTTLYKSTNILTPRTVLGDSWNSEQSQGSMGQFNEKAPGSSKSRSSFEGTSGIVWDNKNQNPYGSTIIGHYLPINGNIVCYNNETGLAIKKEQTNNDGSYKYEKVIEDVKGNMYELVVNSKRDDTTVSKDEIKTKDDFDSGKGVTLPDDKDVTSKQDVVILPSEIGRGEYKPARGVDVLYYEDSTGDLIFRETKSVNLENKYTVKNKVSYLSKAYSLIESSYRIDTTAEKDIEFTGVPVMNTQDLSRTNTATVTVANTHSNKNIVLRVSMKPAENSLTDTGDYIIPSQQLTRDFTYRFGQDFNASAEEPTLPESTEHTYNCGQRCTRNPETGTWRCDYSHTCTRTYKYVFEDFKFAWNDDINTIVPNNLLFANKGKLTTVNDLSKSVNAWDLSVTPELKFTSHRVAVDGVYPTFAKYMNTENSSAISYLKQNKMAGSFEEGLIGSSYSDKGGSKPVSVDISEGTKLSPHGRKGKLVLSHSSCGADDSEVDKSIAPSDWTSKNFTGNVVAEPAIKASSVPVAGKVQEVKKESDMSKTTIFSSPNAIKFYPTFKMFAGGNDAWLLGAEQRSYMPVDVFEVEIVNTNTPIKVESTWSRDAADVGRLVMKGGYNYGVSTAEPVKVKVTSYIHVPKSGYVQGADTDRNGRLATHSSMVNKLSSTSSFNIYSNLPEAYQTDYPDYWKVSNPYKKSGDNVTKSRMSDPVSLRASEGNTSLTTLSLSEMQGKFSGKTQSADRLGAQLESNSWYKEKFDGLEVIKQETVISYNFNQTLQTNFYRNGGNNYNDLAKSAGNIPNGKFGVTAGVQAINYNLYGNNITFNIVPKPFLFDVRGTLYDDRN